METKTKIMIGAGVLGTVGIAWYLKSKSTPTPVAQGAASPGSSAAAKPSAAAQLPSTRTPGTGLSPNTNPHCTGSFAWLTKSQMLGGKGRTMTSCNGSYVLTMQEDGNLVLYSGTDALWNSGTQGASGAYLIMQDDGNLVVYDGSNTPVWNSKTAGHPDAYLALQDDRNLVIYGPSQEVLWATYTQV